MNKPKGFEECLGEYEPRQWDIECGEPVGWGYLIVRRINDTNRWLELGKSGDLVCCSYPDWCLITKKLTREEAIEKYGKVTDEEFGPRGGWKSVTLGTTKFCSRYLMEKI